MAINKSLNDMQFQHAEVLISSDIRFDPDDSSPTYIGTNSTGNDSLTSDTNWVITKLTYSGSNVVRIQKARGSWDNRASLF